VVAYAKRMKEEMLGVPHDLLRDKSAVCAEVAQAMARGILTRCSADLAVAITGVVGPETDEDGNPVGLIYCACARRAGSCAPFASTVDKASVKPFLKTASARR
jgi:PncC family amidohydrolase